MAYFADDLTGATDAMERLELAGVRTALYLQSPSRDRVASDPDIQAVGVAGSTRAMPTNQLEDVIRPALASLRDLGAPHVHYKVCSTFDSSPSVGSIGRVIDVASSLFTSLFIPVVVGTPTLGRWCVFGNLFASMGIGATGSAYRLDRHPSMSQHPTTPADEADLRRHLAKQTEQRVGLVDVRTLALPPEEAASELEHILSDEHCRVVLFDTLTDDHFGQIGALVAPRGTVDEPLFWVGSSAVESVLTAHWRATGQLREVSRPGVADLRGVALVLAGSCSPVTAAQVEFAQESGLRKLTLTIEQIATGERSLEHLARCVMDCLESSESVIVATEAKTPRSQLSAEALGRYLGQLCQQVLRRVRPDLLVLAGGDTSSHTAATLPVESLRFVAPLTPGAPICRIVSSEPWLDGQQIVLKGGQVGRPDFLANLAAGQGGAA
ncbi:four-carbon acid sugar kinase family protein [Aeoliella sp. ICT_H6.2]|uniref:Four-carbon acid sugar kinase family protein n=1 Tax=Aeoliella straminimaris TaxID=2954799 RepID=A0A9X2JKC2_9BACT|nr:four-carbon acid sugar kinase family protein [Aeoliella straminimaris]MCO6046244.1 four-carbon acid sugar kinase family protein [Aeoliella straminimaris]